MGLQLRRSFLTKSVELLAAVPLIGLIAENFRNRTSYYEIDSAAAQTTGRIHPSLDEIAKINTSMGSTLERLHSSYRSAYHKSHVRMVPHITRVGKTTVTRMRSQIYYTWEEPFNVPKHNVIESWRSFQADFTDKVNRLSPGATIDLEKLRELSVVRQRTGEGREGLVSLAMYTPQIAALFFYEEVIAKIRHRHEEHTSAAELVYRHDTQSQVTRRSFFKVAAALTGAMISSPIVYQNRKRREEGKTKLEQEVEEMKDLREITGDEAFSRYFGINPQQMIEQYKSQIKLSEYTLKTDIKDDEIKSAFGQFVQTGNGAVNSLDALIGHGVHPEMGNSIKSFLIAEHLRDKSNSEHRAVYTGLGLTGLAVAGTIAATLVPLEVANEYFTNRVEKNSSPL